MEKSKLSEQYLSILNSIPPFVHLVVVTKKQSPEKIKELYDLGHRVFGENKVQELLEKKELLPADIKWQFIGHLQTNKAKYIVPFVQLIHSVDSIKLAIEIDKQAKKNNCFIQCLLEIHIATEETKYGFSFEEAEDFLFNQYKSLSNLVVAGFMGMASNTSNTMQVHNEFKSLSVFSEKHKETFNLRLLSMGMSNDYKIAMEEGSNMVRLGSIIFTE